MAASMIPPAGAPAFLTNHGWEGSQIAPLAGDASFRRYFRVTKGEAQAVLMDAPPPHEDPRPFVEIAAWLRERGFAAPDLLAMDLARGLLLLEDFGDCRLKDAVASAPRQEQALYTEAVDALIRLHGHEPAPVPAYDRDILAREAALFTDWYCPAVELPVDREGYLSAWNAVFDTGIAERPVTVLRDYHAENLMIRDGRPQGLLDFQDALAGHPAYDLVSLLQDARRDIAPALEQAMLDHYRARAGASDDFMAAYHVLGAQRNAKILGIFTRLWRRDGKGQYPALCPRVWTCLERDLVHPALASVAEWFARAIPAEVRGDPMLVAA